MKPAQIGRLVEQIRREAGLTQAELAALIGTTQAAVSKIETGRTLPGLELLDRIGRALGRGIQITVGESSEPDPRSERRRRVRRALGDYEFDPWERAPTPAERESLARDGLTRERFAGSGSPRKGDRRADKAER
jgi:transcriptional regulator with XRE-family HTH domain